MEAVADGRRVAEQPDERPWRSRVVGQRPQRGAVAVHDDLGPRRIRSTTVQPPSKRQQRLVVGVRGPHDRRREALARGRRATSRSSQAILSREYCQNGLRSGVDSVTGSRAGGVWYAEAELMKTYWPIRPREQVEPALHVRPE